MSRIEPLNPPYPADVQADFDRIMPPGAPPLVLFRTIATSNRAWTKFRAASLAKKRLRPAGLAVMYGDGDSMLPRIKKGDAILFDTTDTRPLDGAIYVVQWRDDVYAKRAEIIDDAVYFRADNPAGDHNWRKPKRMDAKRDPVHVLGRVRWIGSWED